jgi:phenylacetate-CoA ligase
MFDIGYKDWLQKGYYDYRAYVPARLLYHADYFRVRELLGESDAAIAAQAEQRLRHVLGVAVASVPFYRRSVRLTAGELANESPRQLLERFPYVEKAQVMHCQRDFLDERLDPRKLNYATSEGSSGQGIGVWRTKRLADIEKAFYTHEWGKLGFTFDKARYLRMGADARRLAHQPCAEVSGNRLMLSPSHISAQHKSAIVAAINRFRPQFVHAYPSAAAALSELIEAGDLDFQARAVLLASEPATPQQLGLIERLFRCPISISYGLTERTNLAFATGRDGASGPFRFQPLYGVSENRWNNGRAEIVGTSCWNDVMPLIRYCTDDFGTIDEIGNCRAIDGRAHEFLFDRTGKRIPGLLLVVDAVTWDFVRLYQIRQRKPGAITIFVVARHGTLNPAEKKLLLDFQLKRWGSFFDIALNEVADIPLSANGKRQLVVNELREVR